MITEEIKQELSTPAAEATLANIREYWNRRQYVQYFVSLSVSSVGKKWCLGRLLDG